MKKVALFGSTGSIGESTLEVIRNLRDEFRVTALTVNSRIDKLLPQIMEFNPEVVAVRDKAKAEELRNTIGSKCKVLSGEEGFLTIASDYDYDIFLGAMVGFAGLKPTIEAIKRGKRIALANKETLVVAGELVTSLCKETGSELLPVDSEHSAIFQCLTGEKETEVSKIILTASGGPFLKRPLEELKKVSISDALAHPTWQMGAKITIDSASLMNKGLEIIEAKWLFNLAPEKIDVVVHPQSIIHSMVEFVDGSIKAQLSVPDMKVPISYALTYPNRAAIKYKDTNFAKLGQFTFFEPDFDRFRCLQIAYDVLATGGTAPCIANAANEVAVEKFLAGKIKFLDIPAIIDRSLDKIETEYDLNLGILNECDFETRKFAQSLI